MRDAGFPKWLAFTGSLAEHRLVEAMKTAFALRTHLADSGPCTNGTTCTPGTSMVLNSTLSASFADSLRSHHTPTIVLPGWLSLHLALTMFHQLGHKRLVKNADKSRCVQCGGLMTNSC